VSTQKSSGPDFPVWSEVVGGKSLHGLSKVMERYNGISDRGDKRLETYLRKTVS